MSKAALVKPEALEFRHLAACELKFAPDGDQAGEIEAYASIFGELDQGNDIVVRGAYAKSLKARKREDRWDIPMFFGHAHSSVPIGLWTDFREDQRGLKAKGKLLLANSSDARQVRDVVLAGGGMGVSIGYRPVLVKYVSGDGKESADWRPGCVRHLLEVDLSECSLTAMPMCRGAGVTSAKSAAEIDAEHAPILALKTLTDALNIETATRSLARLLKRDA